MKRAAAMFHGSIRIPCDIVDRLRSILRSSDPARLRKAFECATCKTFRCTEVLSASDNRFVCMAKRIDVYGEGADLRATMNIDPASLDVRSILLERMD